MTDGGRSPFTAAGEPRPAGGQVSEYFRLERREVLPPAGSRDCSELIGRAPIDEHQRGAGGGLFTGGLLTNIDSIGGMMCGLAALPKWIVTTSLMTRVIRLDQVGPLRLHGRVLRRGRHSVVGTVDVVDEGAADRPVASSVVTCAVLDPGRMELDIARPVVVPMSPPASDSPLPEEFFCIVAGSGMVTRLELADHLRNPWGILHGGAVASLADMAATRAAASVRGPGVSADTVLHLLSPVRVGPVEARCRIVGIRDDTTVVRVGIHDVGVDNRLAAVASVTVRRAG